MSPTNPTIAAQPARNIFDPWNSSSTGHQRAENRLSGSTSWRDSRSAKLRSQFQDNHRGGARMADTVGAGSEDFGKVGRSANGSLLPGYRLPEQRSLYQCDVRVVKPKAKQHESVAESETPPSAQPAPYRTARSSQDEVLQDEPVPEKKEAQIFRNLTIYINGSTAPLISDHKLKRLLAAHGARLSIALGRRSVTHVVIGKDCASAGAGGGLASTKIQKEIEMRRGKGIKYVNAAWVVESIKAGRRLPESGYAGLKLAPVRQGSVLGMFDRIER